MAWTDEKKQAVIAEYTQIMETEYKTDAEREAATIEVVAELAQKYGEAVNGTRMVLTKAGVYIKKGAGTSSSGGASKAATTTKVSKADSAQALKNAIAAIDPELVDEEIISKLTGKAASYFTAIILKVNA